MSGADISQWQDPNTFPYQDYDFIIIRTSHGTTEDPAWRQHFNNTVNHGKPLGLYHYFEHQSPEAEADYFNLLVSFLADNQVQYGRWLDSEEGRPSSDIDRFRIAAKMNVGLYSNLDGYNNHHREYLHFHLNWLSWPSAPSVPPGWMVPDHIMRQVGINTVDVDVKELATPVFPAWM